MAVRRVNSAAVERMAAIPENGCNRDRILDERFTDWELFLNNCAVRLIFPSDIGIMFKNDCWQTFCPYVGWKVASGSGHL